MPTRRARAFLAEPTTNIDTSSAREYGTLTHIFDRRAARPSMLDPKYQEHLLAELSALDFEPGLDYIIASGSISLLAVTIAAIAAEFGEIRLLCWDSRRRGYVPVSAGEGVRA